ncbi:MAG: hypothetical protein ACXWPK_10665 [Isosphaeraceae bacterium]
MAGKASKPKHVDPEDESQEVSEPGEGHGRQLSADQHPVSTAEAVRAALDTGMKSSEEGFDFIRKNYGIEISKPYLSAIRSQ